MKMIFRWYGENDIIPLEYIRQIPNMSGVVTAVYDVLPGEVWPEKTLARQKLLCDRNALTMEVIESIPVHEDIKKGRGDRDRYIENFKTNLRLTGKYGVKCVCFNFMPVFDWLRTDLYYMDNDGSTALAYSSDDFNKIDPSNLHLPGWDKSYSQEQLQGLLSDYKGISHEQLFDNLVYFLEKIVPVAEEIGVNLAIHPDDPPWDIFGLPRIVSSEADLDRIFAAVPSKRNGLTLCTGSFGAGKSNDLVKMCAKYTREGKLFFTHLRNIKYTDDKDSFCETAHYSKCGSLNMAAIVKALSDNGFDGYVRPDHGRNIWGEDGKPGYGLYDRALGATYINGLFEMNELINKEKK